MKLSLFMRLQCNTLSLAAQGRQLADPCTKQIRIASHHLFLRGLFLPSFSLFQTVFFSFIIFFFAFVFCVCRCFGLLFVLFAGSDCHSNRGIASWFRGALLCLNRYFRHLHMCARLQYAVKCVFLCWALPLMVFRCFSRLSLRVNSICSQRGVLLRLLVPMSPKFHERSPFLEQTRCCEWVVN